MDILVFGVGKKYEEYKRILFENVDYYRIIGFLDNNKNLQGSEVDGIKVYSPNVIEDKELKYDVILILSAAYSQMNNQLKELGVDVSRIWSIEKYLSEIGEDKLIEYNQNDYGAKDAEVLFVCGSMGFDGASMAVISAVVAMREYGIESVIATRSVNEEVLKECLNQKIYIVVYSKLPYTRDRFIKWCGKFEHIIVNTFPMAPVVAALSNIRKIYWWIHEASEYYAENVIKYSRDIDVIRKNRKKICVACVSELAAHIFFKWTGFGSDYILPYCILEDRKYQIYNDYHKNKIIVAIIGLVCPRKGQLEVLNNLMCIEESLKKKIEIRVVGKMRDDSYCASIKKLAEYNKFIKIEGELSHQDIYSLYKRLDVVLVPSREDPLPMVVTEAMMFSVPCIMSDRCGNKELVKNGINAVVYRYDDCDDFILKFTELLSNIENMKIMGELSRKIYEEVFSDKAFFDKINNMLTEH